MAIPAVSPSVINSRVVNVSYYVSVEVDVPWGLDPKVMIPVVLGTVPFRYGRPQQQPQQQNPGIVLTGINNNRLVFINI